MKEPWPHGRAQLSWFPSWFSSYSDLTPLSLSLRVSLKKFSKLKDRAIHRHLSISSLPNQNALMSRSQPACSMEERAASHAPNPGISRDAPHNSPSSSSKTIPKKDCYKVLRPSWIPTSFSTHHLHRLPTSLSSNCSKPHLLTHLFLEGHIILSLDSWAVREKELALSTIMQQAVFYASGHSKLFSLCKAEKKKVKF